MKTVYSIGEALTEQEIRARVAHWNATTTPEQKAAMWKAQRESFVRGMAPCEHGDPDWETCSECRAIYSKDNSHE